VRDAVQENELKHLSHRVRALEKTTKYFHGEELG